MSYMSKSRFRKVILPKDQQQGQDQNHDNTYPPKKSYPILPKNLTHNKSCPLPLE